MRQQYFDWKTYSENNGNVEFPIEAAEEVFLVNLEKQTIWLSKKTTEILAAGKQPMASEMSLNRFEQFLTETTRNTVNQELQRLRSGKAMRASCHAAILGNNGYLSSVVYFFRLPNPDEFLGFFSVDYEPTREYEQHLEQIISQLRRAQLVNELTVEGASDYIYQLDLINNVCTFSSKALEVLPLESPTFSDAMNRVLSFIIPEDRHLFLDSFTPFLSGQSDRHVAEYRVLTKQGDIMWISCKGKGIHDEDGRPIMIAGSLLDITEQKKHEEEIERMLYCDMLTGLKNRLCFEKDMEARMEESTAKGCLLYMDIRKFKLYNELFGHNFGNRVLKELAYMLNLYFPRALGIYRFSGDEFVVHLPEHKRKDILAKITPFLTNLKKTREMDGHTLYINTYIAVVIYPEHGRNVEALMNNANQCLYRMSRTDKEEVSFFAGRVGDEVSQQFLLENEIRKDIEADFRHFRVVYQPIIRLKKNEYQWVGAEALLRYSNPEFPNVDQMEMIRTLEYSGLILQVGRWVISHAVHECKRWSLLGGAPVVHVNMAAQQVSDAGLVRFIRERCEAEDLSPSQLVIELTETSLLNNFEMATTFCEDVMKLGVGIALDDFGTGYSSFNYLKNLPLSQIKVDREYTRQLPTNHYNQIIVSFLYKLAEDLQLELCVEGVETEAELKLLKEMGITIVQGFYFEHPLEADVIRREFSSKMKIEEKNEE